jgi:hypothetical protein
MLADSGLQTTILRRMGADADLESSAFDKVSQRAAYECGASAEAVRGM